MEHILNGLIKLDPGRPAEEIRVTLTRLERAEMHMPDLFSWRAVPTDQNRQIKNAVVHLQQKYPNCIQVGIIPERREQVLALWDPWRMR
jgi:hypothetical protein